jgi:aspartyl-tRNA(Asn)/glutamyl-tRNA(Gln) amidotransferase subunit B
VTPAHLAEIIRMVQSKSITSHTGKDLLDKVEATGRSPSELVEAEGLRQVTDDDALGALARQVLAENPDQVTQYRSGKTTLIGWFVGQVMKRSGGQADPQKARQILEAQLRPS